jgi:hypothetical protein
VTDDTVKMLGYRSHAVARTAFYQRTRALYDADVETDPTALVQSLILMSFWCEDSGITKDAWHWMGNMASLLDVVEPWNDISSRASTGHVPKIVWWCCFVRDAHVSLDMRRQSRLWRFYDKVALPTYEDFGPVEAELPKKIPAADLATAF